MLKRRHFLQLSLAMATLGFHPLAKAAGKPLRLGTLPVISIRTAYEIYRPLMEHLEKNLSLAPIQLEVPPHFKGMYQRIQDGGFDLLISPPHIARLAQKKLGWHPLVTFQPEHQSVLLANETDGPANLEALRGATIAVLDNSALVAMVMMDALAKKGLLANRDFKVIETRSYESSQIAVKQGVAQAMVFRSQGFIDPNARHRFKVLFEAGVLPGYVIIAAPGTNKLQLQKLRTQLLAFGKTPEARPFMEKMGYDNMTAASEEAMRRLDPFLEETELKLK
ncbi:MAG: PhnD/SsuA/transferrin family substrate-binding protein [Azonexus sp.]